MKGKPAKRITFTLTIEYSGGNHFTYEKELLNSRKNCRFYKTNHPRKGNNGGLAGLIANPIGIPTTFLAYITRKTGVAGHLAMTRPWLANSRDAAPISPATNQVLCLRLRSRAISRLFVKLCGNSYGMVQTPGAFFSSRRPRFSSHRITALAS
jgi:hypothetical protein